MTGTPRETANHWDVYWGGRARDGGGPALTGDAPGDLFDGRWRAFFDAELTARPNPRVADLACGAGVVLDRAADALGAAASGGALLCGVDYAYHAASALRRRPGAGRACLCGVQGRVDQPPFADGAFDIVASQFGLEYAGLDAFAAAARLLAPGGAAQHVIHYKDGGIDRECSGNADILRAVLESGLFEKARAVFDGGDAGAALTAASEAGGRLKTLLQGEPSAAKSLLERLLVDIARLLSRRRAYDPRDVRAWLDAMGEEVRQYCARMTAMTQAALDADAVSKAASLITATGCVVEKTEALNSPRRPVPVAWLLTYRRGGA